MPAFRQSIRACSCPRATFQLKILTNSFSPILADVGIRGILYQTPPSTPSQTIAKRKHRLGVGARCSVLFTKLHPGDYVAQHFPNTTQQERLEGLIAIRGRRMSTGRGSAFASRFSPIPITRGNSSIPTSLWSEPRVTPINSLKRRPALLLLVPRKLPKTLAPLRTQEYDEYGKTGGLLLRMLKLYFASGRYVVLDSGFCVLKAILALKTVGGLFAGALIKKRRYWPALVPGPAMDERFAAKAVGEVEAIQGLDVASNTPYFVWCMKESDYVMRIMATGGSLTTDETCKTAHRGVGANRVSFPYMKPYDWHFRY